MKELIPLRYDQVKASSPREAMTVAVGMNNLRDIESIEIVVTRDPEMPMIWDVVAFRKSPSPELSALIGA